MYYHPDFYNKQTFNIDGPFLYKISYKFPQIMVPKLIATYFTCFQAMMAEIIAILGLEIQNATKFACETSETLFYRDAYSSFFGKLELAGETIYMYIVRLYICITFRISTFIVSCLTLVAMRVVPTDLRNNTSIDYKTVNIAQQVLYGFLIVCLFISNMKVLPKCITRQTVLQASLYQIN